MYSLLIVEDEYTTRQALVNMIRWEELGFRVDGEFSDGQGVLDYLKNNIPDVILTDIKMTKVNGIEIARLVFEQNLPVRIVFLSAYKDFAYAQEAVEYQVTHYLLKPVDLSRLRDIFKGIKEKLDKEGEQERILQERVNHYNGLINYEKQQFVTDAYFGSLDNPEKMAKRLGLVASKKEGEGACLFFLKIVLKNNQRYKDFLIKYGQQELQEQLVHILGYFNPELEFYPIVWSMTKDDELSVLGVFWGNGIVDLSNCNELELEGIIYNLMSIHVEIPIFKYLRSPAELVGCAKWIGKDESSDDLMQDLEYLQLLREQNKLLYSYLCQNNPVQGLNLVNALFDNYLRSGVDFAWKQCIYTVTKLLDEIAGSEPVVFNRLYSQFMSSMKFGSIQSNVLRKKVENCIKGLFNYVSEREVDERDTSIEKVMAYLHEHYKEDIALTNIAENVFLNPSYISRLIKEKTGKNYTDLVMEMRIERAVEFLENSDMYVYEIAEKVGYSNLKYFYKVFKKITGKSPKDYRKS